MTKSELLKYRRRRFRIMQLTKQGHTQAEIARKLKMKPQRVNQILARAELRPKDKWLAVNA